MAVVMQVSSAGRAEMSSPPLSVTELASKGGETLPISPDWTTRLRRRSRNHHDQPHVAVGGSARERWEISWSAKYHPAPRCQSGPLQTVNGLDITAKVSAAAMGQPNDGYKARQDGIDVNVAPLMPPSRGDDFSASTSAGRPRVSLSGRIQSWTAIALVLSYFVFSIALYTVLNQEATKVFWFLYLAIATIVAGATALEAYDGLTPLKEALKATAKFEKDDHKFKTSDDALPLVELVFVLEQGKASDLNAMKQIRNTLLYPSSLVRINVLCHEHSIAHALANDYDGSLEMAGVRIYVTPPHAQNSLSARLSHFLQAAGPMAASIMAIFARDQRPHPHAMRIAVERLMQDSKVDVIQGRTVRVPQGRRSSFFAALANIEHDMMYALLHPGRAITWTFNAALDSNAYWRTETLRAATGATVGVARTGHDIGFTAVAQGAKTVNDLRLVCFEPCPATYASYLNTQATEARQWVLAATRYTSIAFRKSSPKDGSAAGKVSGKSRFAVIYELVMLRIASHAIVQYLCMALALLFTETPSSTLQFAYLIYFPYPISEWLMVGGFPALRCASHTERGASPGTQGREMKRRKTWLSRQALPCRSSGSPANLGCCVYIPYSVQYSRPGIGGDLQGASRRAGRQYCTVASCASSAWRRGSTVDPSSPVQPVEEADLGDDARDQTGPLEARGFVFDDRQLQACGWCSSLLAARRVRHVHARALLLQQMLRLEISVTNNVFTDSIIAYFNETPADTPVPTNLFTVDDYEHRYEKGWSIFYREGAAASNVFSSNIGTAEWNIQPSILNFTISPYTPEHLVDGAQIQTVRKDIQYGSFRALIKSPPWASGSAMTMKLEHNKTISAELDLQPMDQNLYDATLLTTYGGHPPANLSNGLNYTSLPSYDSVWGYLPYRMDWTKDNITYTVDNTTINTLPTVNATMVDMPSALMFKHWSTGDVNWMQGPPVNGTSAGIGWVRLFFNSSLVSESQLVQGTCDPSQYCSTEDTTLRLSTPYTDAMTTQETAMVPPPSKNHTAGIAIIIASLAFSAVLILHALARKAMGKKAPVRSSTVPMSRPKMPTSPMPSEYYETKNRPESQAWLTAKSRPVSEAWTTQTDYEMDNLRPMMAGSSTTLLDGTAGSARPYYGPQARSFSGQPLLHSAANSSATLGVYEKNSPYGRPGTGSDAIEPLADRLDASTADLLQKPPEARKDFVPEGSQAAANPGAKPVPAPAGVPQARTRVDYLAGLVAVCSLLVSCTHFILTFVPSVIEEYLPQHYASEYWARRTIEPFFFNEIWVGIFFTTSTRFLTSGYLRTGSLKTIAEKVVCRCPRLMIPITAVILFEYFLMDLGATTYLEYIPSISWSTWPSTTLYTNFGFFVDETLQLFYLIPNAAPQLTQNFCTDQDAVETLRLLRLLHRQPLVCVVMGFLLLVRSDAR
nr:hypothetical protein CFP56_34681 [Quercus suber]